MKRPGRMLIAILLGLTCATARAADTLEEIQQAQHRAAAALKGRKDADSILAATLLSNWLNKGEEQLADIRRAFALEPDRRDIAWMYLVTCLHVSSCDALRVEKELQRLDKGNAAGWFGSLRVASKEKEGKRIDESLRSMASAERFDTYWNASVARVGGALISTRKFEPEVALTLAAGPVAALSIPAFGDLSNSCKGSALDDPQRRELCQGVARVLQAGDTAITASMGTHLGERAWPEGSLEHARAIEQRRTTHYRLLAGTEALERRTKSDEAQYYFGLMSRYRTEQEAMLAALTEAGKSPDPPSGWVDPWEHPEKP